METRMKWKRRYYSIPIIAVMSILLWSVVTPSTAIVEARVSLTANYGNGFLSQVRSTHAFQTSDGGWIFEVWSRCSLSVNQTVDISVQVSGELFGSQPTDMEASLYKVGGLMNTGFIPWDGCT